MYTDLLEKRLDIIYFLFEEMKSTQDSDNREFYREQLINYLNKLSSLDSDKEQYQKLFYNLGLKQKDYSYEQKLQYKKELITIFKNPNEISFNVWLKNLILFSKENNISDTNTQRFIKEELKKVDINDVFYSKIDSMILKINNYYDSENLRIITIADADKYVYENILKQGGEIKENFTIIVKDLNESLISLNRNNLKEDFGAINDIIVFYKLDRDVVKFYFSNIIKKSNIGKNIKDGLLEELNIIVTGKSSKKETKEQNNSDNKKDSQSDTVKKDKENEKNAYKIVSVKKNFASKNTGRILRLTALIGLGVLTNPLFAAGIGIGAYYLYKRNIKKTENIIKKCGYTLDNDDNLIDSNGKIVLKEDLGNIRYNMVKKQLMNIENSTGKINKNFKKNRLSAMLLNIPIINKIKNKFTCNDNYDENIETKDIKKGMRLIKW